MKPDKQRDGAVMWKRGVFGLRGSLDPTLLLTGLEKSLLLSKPPRPPLSNGDNNNNSCTLGVV